MANDLMVVPDDYVTSPASLRQDARLDAVPEIYRKTHERLAVELAMRVDDATDIFASYGYIPEQAADLMEQPAFQALLRQAQSEVVEEGLSFRTKAKLIAGELLPYAHDIATDPLQPTSVRADLIKWSAKVAGFEPKDMRPEASGGGAFEGMTAAVELKLLVRG